MAVAALRASLVPAQMAQVSPLDQKCEFCNPSSAKHCLEIVTESDNGSVKLPMQCLNKELGRGATLSSESQCCHSWARSA